MFVSAFSRRFRKLPSGTQGWVICLAVLMLTVVRSGITYSFGVFVVKLEAQDNKTAMAVQNWIGTLSFTIAMGISPISVLIIRTMGQHGYQIAAVTGVLVLTVSCFLSSIVAQTNEMWMFLTHSIMYGIGSSLTLMSSSLVIGEYFDKQHRYHVLATSSLLCGYPVGSLLFNPINGWLVDLYGVEVAFRVTGFLILIVGLPCCLPFLSRLESDTNDPIDYGDFKRRMGSCCNPKQFMVRPEIGLWLLGNMMSFIGFYMPFVNLAYYMKRKNIALAQSKWAVTVLSLAECITYMIASVLGDHLKGRLILINLVAAIGLSTICFLWPFVDTSFDSILVSSAILGGLLGLTIVYQYAASGEVTKLPIDVAWSATNLWSGLGVLAGPLFSGVIYDIRHNYDDVWFVCGGLYLAQVLVFGGIPAIWRYRIGVFASDDYIEIVGETKDYMGYSAPAEAMAITNAATDSANGEGWAVDSKTMGGTFDPPDANSGFYQPQQPPQPPPPPPPPPPLRPPAVTQRHQGF